MPYLSITEKCNMKCAHCCYSCDMKGKHADIQTIMDSISFAAESDDEFITIGGGEPTLHPDFFRILERCLCTFENVWMATNGSQTEIMLRLANIMHGEDYPEYDCDCEEEYGTEEYEEYGCLCHEKMDDDSIYGAEDKLSVAVSQDCFHDPIDERIISLWKNNKWELRNVYDSWEGLANAGRAKENQLNTDDHCCCSDFIIKINGDLKLCGCPESPIIGHIYDGISEYWEDIINGDDFNDTRCYQSIKKIKEKI